MSAQSFVAAREAALERLIALVEATPAIAALWLQGSLADATSDALSDVDAYLAIDDAAFDDIYAQRRDLIGEAGHVLAWSNATSPGIHAIHALLDGPVKIDLFFERVSAVASAPRKAVKVLIDKTGIAAGFNRTYAPPNAYAAFVLDVMIRMQRQGALWPVRLLMRGQPSAYLAMALDLVNKELALFMALQADASHIRTNPFSLARALSDAQRRELDTLTEALLCARGAPGALCQAHLAVLDALVREGRAACAALAIAYPIDAEADSRLRALLAAHWPPATPL